MILPKKVIYLKKVLIFTLIMLTLSQTAVRADSKNRVDTLSETEYIQIRAVVAACADIMSFDIKDYDYDKLFKYVLYTHENFRILTDIPPGTGSSSTTDYNSVSIVRSEYIDYIMNNIFTVPPEKPPADALLTRGFCYNNGYYYYTGGFDVYFATEINDIIGVYDMADGVTLVVFTDTYREGETKTTERSFAVLQKNTVGYSLLRIGMGANPPAGEEIAQYASPAPTEIPSAAEKGSPELTMSALLLLGAAGIMGFILAIIALIRQVRKTI